MEVFVTKISDVPSPRAFTGIHDTCQSLAEIAIHSSCADGRATILWRTESQKIGAELTVIIQPLVEHHVDLQLPQSASTTASMLFGVI